MSVLEKLTEGIVKRSLQQEGTALLDKWDRTGLLEGLGADHKRNTMASLIDPLQEKVLPYLLSGKTPDFLKVSITIKISRVWPGF